MADNWLDSWTTRRRLPSTFLAVKRWHTRHGRADTNPHGLAIIPYEESMMIMRHGKKHWRQWKASGKPVCDCCQRPAFAR